jgi:hypothetical protein
LLPFEIKSSETPVTIPSRSRAIFLAAGLLGVAGLAAAKVGSVTADNVNAPSTKTEIAKTDRTKPNGANGTNSDDAAARGASEVTNARAADGSDQSSGDAVGTIEGDAIALQGPMSVEVVHGQVKTMLHSGNDIRVKSGQARIDLVEGGKIAICGPAHFSVLKSGGSLTLALDTGIVHIHIDRAPSVVVYTAQIQATPVAIGEGAQDALIGFDANNVMCVRASTGAIRLEQQLSGQSVLVPQGGDILLNNGALDSLANTGGHCECEVQLAKDSAVPPPEVSRMATPEEIAQRDAAKAAEAAAEKEAAANAASDKVAAEKEAADKAAAERAAAERAAAERLAAENGAKPPVPWGEPVSPTVAKKTTPKTQEPVYQVFMPPLAFDAKAAEPPDNFDPKFIVLVRRVRVKPTLIFKGTVEGETPVAKQVSEVKPLNSTAKVGPVAPPNVNPAKPQASQQTTKPPAQPPDNSVVNRVRNYIRHLFS